MSSTMILAPVSLTNSSVARPMGPAPMIERRFVRLRGGAVRGVTADRQRLDEGELVEGEFRRNVQLPGRHDELRPQTAVAVDAEDFELLAAVRLAAAAGVTVRVVDVRLDGAAVAGLDVRHALADRHDLDAQLVAGDARIAEERHLAEIAADVGAADADTVDAHQRLAGTGFFGPSISMRFQCLGASRDRAFMAIASSV